MTAMGATRSPEHGGRDADGWTVGRALGCEPIHVPPTGHPTGRSDGRRRCTANRAQLRAWCRARLFTWRSSLVHPSTLHRAGPSHHWIWAYPAQLRADWACTHVILRESRSSSDVSVGTAAPHARIAQTPCEVRRPLLGLAGPQSSERRAWGQGAMQGRGMGSTDGPSPMYKLPTSATFAGRSYLRRQEGRPAIVRASAILQQAMCTFGCLPRSVHARRKRRRRLGGRRLRCTALRLLKTWRLRVWQSR